MPSLLFTTYLTKKNLLIIFSLVIVFLYLSPYFFLGKNVVINHWDNLDGGVVWLKSIINSNTYFGSLNSVIPYFGDGYDRNLSFSDLTIYPLFFYLFGDFNAYVLIKLLIHFIAFLGMYKLLENHFFEKNHYDLIIFSSLCFSILPFIPIYGLSIAGVPLAFNTFLNFRNKTQNYFDWIVLLVLHFFGWFIFSFFFIAIIFFVILLFDFLKNKKINTTLFVALFTFNFLFLIFEYRLFYYMFISPEIDSMRIHNTEFIGGFHPYSYFFSFIKKMILSGTSATPSYQYPIILFTILLGCNNIIIKDIDPKNRTQISFLFFFIISLIFLSFILRSPIIFLSDFLSSFNFSRFFWILPAAWYVLFYLCLLNIKKNLKFGKYIAYFLISFQLIFLFSKSNAISGLLSKSNLISYNQFYATELFDQIKKDIKQPIDSFKVISIGIEPMIAMYNGFNTLDGYVTDYKKSYKVNFRKIIEKELDKSEHWRSYFDNWGGRCYVFVSELEFIGKDYRLHYHSIPKDFKIKNLELNIQAFKDLGGLYIISNVEIINYSTKGLIFLNEYQNKNSPYNLRLYLAK